MMRELGASNTENCRLRKLFDVMEREMQQRVRGDVERLRRFQEALRAVAEAHFLPLLLS